MHSCIFVGALNILWAGKHNFVPAEPWVLEDIVSPYPEGMRRWFWVIDAVVVVSFVLVGRDNHGFVSDWNETLRVAAPFLISLALAIVLVRAWKDPLTLLTGFNIGAITLVVGMLLRKFIWGDGTALSFVIVTAVWLIGWMVAWRLIGIGIGRYRSRRAT